jgi:choline-sulfatase
MIRKGKAFGAVCVLIALAVPLVTIAAPITWGPATDVSAASDVSTNGLTLEAVNAAADTNTADLTVNGVVFGSTGEVLDLDSTIDAYSGSTGDAAYDALLSSVDYGGGGALFTVALGGGILEVGSPYEIQVWFIDTRNSRVMQFGDGNSNAVDLASTPGQYAIGTFTADGTNQSLSFDAQGFGNAHINAYQIRFLGPTPLPDVPTQLVATNGYTAEINLDWDDNHQLGFSHFKIKRSLNSGGPYTEVAGATPSESDYVDTGLTIGVTYYYVVSALNVDDIESGDSGEASALAQVYVAPLPAVPTNLTVQAGNDRNFLDWDDNTQPGFKEFRIKRSTVSGGVYTQSGTSVNSTFVDTTAVNGTPYFYVVTAINTDDVESAPSAEMSATPSVSAEPPNFLFIIADDMDTFSVNRYRETEPCETDTSGAPYTIDTPNIDRLADEGMIFHQARLMGANIGAVCTPSRTTIMSGKNTWQRTAGVTAATTFPGVFNRGARSGDSALPYATYRTCKSGNSYPTANLEFTVVNDASKRGNTDGNGSEWHGDWGVDYIDDWAANHQVNGTPFLIYLGFSHPHDERLARENPNLTGRYGCVNTSDPATLTLNTNAPPLPYNHLSCTPETFPAHPFENGHSTVRDEVSAPGILTYRTEAVVRNEIGRNFACVDWIDQQIGRVLPRLEDPNGDGDTSDSVVENTYVVFTSDHGIAIGRHGLQGKQNLYEHTWRVPYIVRGPGIEAGSSTDALIYLHDTFPTLCDLAGIDVPGTIDNNDGQSFRAVLEGTATSHRDVVYGLYAGGDKPGMRAITDGRFKLIKYDVDSNATQVTQLFDLQENPFELLPEHGVPNIATEPAYALIRQELEERLMEKRIEYADPYAFLGDRSLWRFEDDLTDYFPFSNDGTATNGPLFSTDVPNADDYVVGAPNTRSLDLEQDSQQYLQVPDAASLDFDNAPFTIEAWVKLETLPVGVDAASTMPLVQKKVIGEGDAGLNYMFLAAAGSYGNATTYSNLALHLGTSFITSTLAIPDTNWHHISVALDPVTDTLRFTMDDQVDTQSTTATGTANAGPLVIGAHHNASSTVDSSFDGLIDELSITDGFMVLAELQPLQGIPAPEPSRVRSPSVSTSGITLSVDVNPLFLYNVESTPRLVNPEWTLERSFMWDAGDLLTMELAESMTTTTFYRVQTLRGARP